MTFPPIYLVVLAGGSGTRFWPKSRKLRPKQLLKFGNKTLLEQTVDRFKNPAFLFSKNLPTWIVTTSELRAPIINIFPTFTGVHVLAEPEARNTAPALFWIAKEIEKKDPDALMVVMPSDHLIFDENKFLNSLNRAVVHALEHKNLVTLGIRPVRPETGYGYLEQGPLISEGVFRVTRFVEKPNLDLAQNYIKAGNFLWNGGMFVWCAKTLLQEFLEHAPSFEKIWNDSGERVEKAYPRFAKTSVDYAVMEKSRRVSTLVLDCGWDDIGTWTSLELACQAGRTSLGEVQAGNLLLGGRLISQDSSGNIIDVPNKVVATLGVDDLVIVESDGALLIAKKGRAQEIKDIVEQVRKDFPDLV